MNDAKYIGLDVHQATISAARAGRDRQTPHPPAIGGDLQLRNNADSWPFGPTSYPRVALMGH